MGIFKNIIYNSLKENSTLQEETKKEDAFIGYANNQGLDNEDQILTLFNIAQNKTAKETKKDKDSFGAEEMPILWSTFKELVKDAIDKQKKEMNKEFFLQENLIVENYILKKGTKLQIK